MARKNCGVLIRETMIGIEIGLGNRYNPRIPIPGRLLHHHRTVQTLAPPNSMPTTAAAASAIPSSNASASSLASLPARVSASGVLSASALGPGSKLLFPSPQDMIMLTEKEEYKRAIKQVKGGRLPAVFYFTGAACPNTVTYSIPIVRKIREHFPHVKLYKVLITVEVWCPNLLT
ncbi:thioredoxin O1 [Pyrus ussuriensis x Pyrus communis]|uniref:Thioredoxin O1 n=1 Tax=Pyrus ussuriensis x Pyrus communis TaxID=2448454 RepID=A0A5N5H0I9_9ROSA|nr:thioredoxin O1 [Pyrus ussuriensis x Pyrus communis]